MKPVTDVSVRQINADTHITDFSAEYSKEVKEKILEYMKKQDVFSYTTAPVFDVYTREKTGEYDNGRSDEVFYWHESTIYYFEKYNLKLNKEFIDHIMKAS